MAIGDMNLNMNNNDKWRLQAKKIDKNGIKFMDNSIV